MKKFAKNIILFLIIPIIVMLLLNFFISPYYGNEYYNTKYDFFNKNKEKYNTVVFGSSRLYRHINSSLLDSLMSKYNFSTFNLAAPSTHNPEVYYLYEKFISNIESNTISYAFIELQPLNSIAEKNINTARNYYWFNLKYLIYSYRYIFNSAYLNNRRYMIKAYSKSFVNKLLDFNKYKYAFMPVNSDTTIIGRRGFYSLNQQMNDIGGENALNKRLSDFMKDTTVLQERIEASIIERNNLKKHLNKIHLDKLNEIINLSREKGIHIFFVIPPKLGNYKELYAIKENLPNENIIDISSAVDYPNLYKTKYTFDIGHLNEKGANLFTEYLANEIKKCL